MPVSASPRVIILSRTLGFDGGSDAMDSALSKYQRTRQISARELGRAAANINRQVTHLLLAVVLTVCCVDDDCVLIGGTLGFAFVAVVV